VTSSGGSIHTGLHAISWCALGTWRDGNDCFFAHAQSDHRRRRPLIRGFVREILEENGYAVEEAANIDEALLLLDGNGFAAVPPISKCRGF
jgi:hypothetical protein